MLKLQVLSLIVLSRVLYCTGDTVEATDKECVDRQTCKNQEECPEFLEKKYYLNTLSTRGSEYKDTLDEIRGWVCNKKKKSVCCPLKNDVQQIEGKNSSWLPRKRECGINPLISPSRIVGGVDTAPGQFPFTALLGYPAVVRRNGREVKLTRYKCGGTLINYWYVVTAAHCQGASTGSQISTVRLGDWEVGRDPDCIIGTNNCINRVQDFLITADQVTVHDNYGKISSGNIVNDIALVKLDRPAVLNIGVRIVCLPINMTEAAEELNLPNLSDGLTGKYPLVVGWGYTEYDPHVAGGQQGDFAKDNVASAVQHCSNSAQRNGEDFSKWKTLRFALEGSKTRIPARETLEALSTCPKLLHLASPYWMVSTPCTLWGWCLLGPGCVGRAGRVCTLGWTALSRGLRNRLEL